MTKYYIEREENLKELLSSEWIYYNPPDAEKVKATQSMLTYEQIIAWCPICKNEADFRERYVELIIPENVQKMAKKRQNLFGFGKDIIDIHYRGLKIVDDLYVHIPIEMKYPELDPMNADWNYSFIQTHEQFDPSIDIKSKPPIKEDEKMEVD